MSASSTETKILAHHTLDLEEIILEVSDTIRETFWSMVILKSKDYFRALSVAIFLENTFVEFDVLFSTLKSLNYSDIFVIDALPHTCGHSVVPLYFRESKASYKEMSSNLIDITTVWQLELWIRSLYLKCKGIDIFDNFSYFCNLA